MGYTYGFMFLPDGEKELVKILSAYSLVQEPEFIRRLLDKYGYSWDSVEEFLSKNEIRRNFKLYASRLGPRAYRIIGAIATTRFSPPEKVFEYAELFNTLMLKSVSVEELFKSMGLEVEGKNTLRLTGLPATLEITVRGATLHHRSGSIVLGDYVSLEPNGLRVLGKDPMGVFVNGRIVYGRSGGRFVFAYKDIFYEGKNLPLAYSFIAYSIGASTTPFISKVEVEDKTYDVAHHPPIVKINGLPYKFVDINGELVEAVREIDEPVELVFGSREGIRRVLGLLDYARVKAEFTVVDGYAYAETGEGVTVARAFWEPVELWVKPDRERAVLVACRSGGDRACYMHENQFFTLTS